MPGAIKNGQNGFQMLLEKQGAHILLFACLFLLPVSQACGKPSAALVSYESLQFRKAADLFLHHHHREAIQICTQILQNDSGYGAAFVLRGECEVILGDTDAGMTDLNQALKMNIRDFEIYYYLGQAFIQRNDYRCAVTNYGKALELAPHNPMLLREQAEIYGELHEFAKALECNTRAIEEGPGMAGNFVSRGHTYFAMGQYQKAINDYSQALKLEPVNLRTYGCRASAYKKLGRKDLYEADIKKANEGAVGL